MSLFVREKDSTKFFWLTLVIGMQNLISVGVNLSDNVMLGGYSESALSGVALANQIQFLLHMLVLGVCEGLVIMSSRFWGAKDLGLIKKRQASACAWPSFSASCYGLSCSFSRTRYCPCLPRKRMS